MQGHRKRSRLGSRVLRVSRLASMVTLLIGGAAHATTGQGAGSVAGRIAPAAARAPDSCSRGGVLGPRAIDGGRPLAMPALLRGPRTVARARTAAQTLARDATRAAPDTANARRSCAPAAPPALDRGAPDTLDLERRMARDRRFARLMQEGEPAEPAAAPSAHPVRAASSGAAAPVAAWPHASRAHQVSTAA